jgi:hypothetical protein
MHIEFSLENLKRREHSEDLGVDGRIILKLSSGNRFAGFGLNSSGSGQGPVACSCEHGN